ncbi:hypothetical protein KCU81_g8321, partial [Aureobasidium melanogenum]|uniref:Uncharacterized protein n=1 Tax=Aureobasidium melanogenum (strain CBS 110374) TaxID=1043003 RepID=A0A074VPG8_AURM1
MDTSSTNGHGNSSVQQHSNQPHLATKEVTMEIEPVNKKPIKRIVPEKIAEVGQWKAPVVTEEDKAINEDGKAVHEDGKMEMSTEGVKTN